MINEQALRSCTKTHLAIDFVFLSPSFCLDCADLKQVCRNLCQKLASKILKSLAQSGFSTASKRSHPDNCQRKGRPFQRLLETALTRALSCSPRPIQLHWQTDL